MVKETSKKKDPRRIYRYEIKPDSIPDNYIDDRHPVFKRVCHGSPERGFFLNGKPMPLCARCTGFYLMLGVGILASFPLFFSFNVDPFTVLIITISMILPMALDGSTQYLGLRISNNPLRAITGALGGLGSGVAFTYLILSVFL
mgnify:CR=1 FL=1